MYLNTISKFKVDKIVNYNILTCIAVVRDVTEYPGFMTNIKTVSLLENSESSKKYKVEHVYLNKITDPTIYNMNIKKDSINIYGWGSKYYDWVKYDWGFEEIEKDKTKINLDFEIKFKYYAYLPIWNSVRDILMKRGIDDFSKRVDYLSK